MTQNPKKHPRLINPGLNKQKRISLKDASTAEAHARIDNVLMPYLENLHVKHDSQARALVEDLRVYLRAEFEDFGFTEIPL